MSLTDSPPDFEQDATLFENLSTLLKIQLENEIEAVIESTENLIEILRELTVSDTINWARLAQSTILKSYTIAQSKANTRNSTPQSPQKSLISKIYQILAIIVPSMNRCESQLVSITLESVEILLRLLFQSNSLLSQEILETIVKHYPKNTRFLFLSACLLGILQRNKDALKTTETIEQIPSISQIQRDTILSLKVQIEAAIKERSSNDPNEEQNTESRNTFFTSLFLNGINGKKQSNSQANSKHPASTTTPRINNKSIDKSKILIYNDEWEESVRFGPFKYAVYTFKKIKTKISGSCKRRNTTSSNAGGANSNQNSSAGKHPTTVLGTSQQKFRASTESSQQLAGSMHLNHNDSYNAKETIRNDKLQQQQQQQQQQAQQRHSNDEENPNHNTSS